MAIGTALAAASIASSAVGAGMSFAQANKQRKLQRQAEADAEKAMLEARQKLDVNFAEQMAIKKEAYDLERQAMLSAGAQATEAGMMSERGAAATAGRVFAGQQEAQGKIRSAMADEMTNIESAILEEEGRLRDLSVGLDLQEVAGQQQRAADAQAAALSAQQQGVEGIVNAAEKGIQYIPLYGKKANELGNINDPFQIQNALQQQGMINYSPSSMAPQNPFDVTQTDYTKRFFKD